MQRFGCEKNLMHFVLCDFKLELFLIEGFLYTYEQMYGAKQSLRFTEQI